MADIMGAIKTAYGASSMGAILLVVIGLVIGVIVDRMLSMMMMGGMMV